MKDWKQWLYSLAAAVIGSVATTVYAAVAMPDVFNFTHAGWVHLGKLAAIAALTTAAAFLKQSPLPSGPSNPPSN